MADRFSEVIGKMEEETKKAEKKKKEQKKEVMNKYDVTPVKKKKDSTSVKEEVKTNKQKKETKSAESKKNEKQPKKTEKAKTKTNSTRSRKEEVSKKKIEEKKVENKVENKKEDIKKEKTKVKEQKQPKRAEVAKHQKKDDEKKQDKVKLSKHGIELDIIKDEITGKSVLTKDRKKRIYSEIAKSILMAILIVLIYIEIEISYNVIKADVFIMALNIASLIGIVFTIILFEVAYKKDGGSVTFYSIEAMVISISYILLIYTYSFYKSDFKFVISIFMTISTVYYLLKSIVIFFKGKRKLKMESLAEYGKEMKV